MREAHVKRENTKKQKTVKWRFTDPPNAGVYTTKRIMNGDDPVTRVFHDADDGAWQFHGPRRSKAKDAVLVCLEHMVDRDDSINELADLPVGWCAWRKTVTSPWKRAVQDTEDQ